MAEDTKPVIKQAESEEQDFLMLSIKGQVHLCFLIVAKSFGF
jgi:hypothetical protein